MHFRFSLLHNTVGHESTAMYLAKCNSVPSTYNYMYNHARIVRLITDTVYKYNIFQVNSVCVYVCVCSIEIDELINTYII